MSKLRTRRGKPILNRSDLPTLAATDAAPNAIDLSASVNFSEVGPVLNVTGLIPDYAKFLIIWIGEDGNGNPLIDSCVVPAAAGGLPEGSLRQFTTAPPTKFRLCIIDVDGNIGMSTGTIAVGDSEPTFLVTQNPVLGASQTENDAAVFTPPVYIADDAVTVSYVYSMAEDGSGTSDGGEESWDNGLVPAIDGDLDHWRIGAVFVGPGVDNGGPYWSSYSEINAEDVTTPVTVSRAPLVASQKLVVDGVVAAFVAGETLTAGSASAVIVAYVSATSTTGTLYLGPITNGPIADNATLTSPSGGGTANGASAAYPLKAGQNFYTLPPAFNGTPTSNVSRQEIANDDTGTGKQAAELSGVIPAAQGSKYYAYTHRYTGYGVDSPWAETTTGWLQIGVPTLLPLTADQWAFTTSTVLDAGVNKAKLEVFRIPASLGATELWWTTGQDSYLDATPHPGGREQMTLLGTEVISGVTWQRWQAADAIAGGKNYRLFDATDGSRAERLGIIAMIGGALSPVSVRKEVTIPDQPQPTGRQWVRAILRVQGQADIGEPGGTGMQFPRAFDVSGNYVAQSYDILGPSESFDFGENWGAMRYPGLTYSQSVTAILIDGKYVHGMFGGAWMEQLGDYDDYTGIYRLNRDTGVWTSTKKLWHVYGSNQSPTRRNIHYIAKVPGSGSGPDTRTLYALYAPAAYGTQSGGFSTTQLYKANGNGGSSWATDGSELAKADYGIPFGIDCNSGGNIFLWTDKGLWRRNNSGTWKKASFPTEAGANPSVANVEIRGTTIYAGVRGKGIYTATDEENLDFTRLVQGNLYYFSVSPANTDRICWCGPGGSNRVKPRYTKNGGSTWNDISTQKFPGQFNDFEHLIHAEQAWFKWHDTDPDLCIAMRYHHMGKSYDGGATFVWSSRGFDYSGVNAIGFSHRDYRKAFLNMTDRLYCYTPSAFAYVTDDSITADMRATINGYVGRPPTSANTSSGALILENGNHTALVGHIGWRNGNRTPVENIRTVDTETSSGNGNGSASISASAAVPTGYYTFVCTTAGANAIFRGTGPLGLDMGTWTAGVQSSFNVPNGGTITATFTNGSNTFQVGKTFTLRVNHIGEQNPINPSSKTRGDYGYQNPANASRGFTGRHRYSLSSSGVLSRDLAAAYEVVGYGGSGGSVVYGITGSNLRRSTDEGDNWGSSNWWSSGNHNINAPGGRVVFTSSHDDQRVYAGTSLGLVLLIQNGTAREIFSMGQWFVDNGVNPDMGGMGTVAGRKVTWITGIVESYYDPNLVYCSTMVTGYPYQVFRTKNATADVPVWENITLDGVVHPIAGIFINPVTDEPVVVGNQGTIVFDVGDAHRTAHGITASIAKEIQAGRGSYQSMGV